MLSSWSLYIGTDNWGSDLFWWIPIIKYPLKYLLRALIIIIATNYYVFRWVTHNNVVSLKLFLHLDEFQVIRRKWNKSYFFKKEFSFLWNMPHFLYSHLILENIAISVRKLSKIWKPFGFLIMNLCSMLTFRV